MATNLSDCFSIKVHVFLQLRILCPDEKYRMVIGRHRPELVPKILFHIEAKVA